jgi:hypothetical protein
MAAAADPLTHWREVDGLAAGFAGVSGLGRIAIGVGLAAAPQLALRTLGFRRPSSTTVAVSRLAGGRDLVLGALTLAAMGDRERLRTATLAAAAVDGGDALTFAACLGDSETRRAAMRGLSAAVPATVAGLWAARRLS